MDLTVPNKYIFLPPMRSRPKNTLILFSLFILLQGCDIINPEEEIPAYITVNKFEVDGINGLPPSEDVRDVWVTVNNEFIGLFEFNENDRITFPVLSSGNSKINLRPGILADAGFNEIHQSYPYYRAYETFLDLKPEETTIINPTTSYTDDAIRVPETTDDFETGLNRQYRSCLGCPVALEIIDSDNPNYDDLFIDRNGTALALMTIPQGSSDSVHILTKTAFPVTNNASQIWLEFDYKSNIIFTAGLDLNSQVYYRIQPFLVASPNEWTKVYLALIDDFSYLQSLAPGIAYNLVFTSPSSDGEKEYYIAIDNIRLIVPNL